MPVTVSAEQTLSTDMPVVYMSAPGSSAQHLSEEPGTDAAIAGIRTLPTRELSTWEASSEPKASMSLSALLLAHSVVWLKEAGIGKASQTTHTSLVLWPQKLSVVFNQLVSLAVQRFVISH